MTATKPALIGEPKIATPEQMKSAIMFGRIIWRDEDAAYYRYKGDIYVLPAIARYPAPRGPAAELKQANG